MIEKVLNCGKDPDPMIIGVYQCAGERKKNHPTKIKVESDYFFIWMPGKIF